MQSSETHECAGAACSHVIDTGEGLVCTITGIVVGDVMMASFDYLAASSRYVVRGGTNSATSITKTLEPSANFSPVDTKRTPTSKLNEDLHGECFRVVANMLRDTVIIDEVWRDAIIARCVNSCGMCVASGNATVKHNTKTAYVCLATLYLIREGLTVNGTVVCKQDEFVKTHLPTLTALNRYGFDKGKFTKAMKLLLHIIDCILLSKPLHQVHV